MGSIENGSGITRQDKSKMVELLTSYMIILARLFEITDGHVKIDKKVVEYITERKDCSNDKVIPIFNDTDISIKDYQKHICDLLNNKEADICSQDISAYIGMKKDEDWNNNEDRNNEIIGLLLNFESDNVINFSYPEEKYEYITHGMLEKTFLNIYRTYVCDKMSILLKDVQLCNDKEFNELINNFNKTEVVYDQSVLIHELFERQVIKTPGKIAVKETGNDITYDELNKRANRLAHFLNDKFNVKNRAVSIITDRNIDMIVYLLAVLKAGGYYIPIEPDIPMDRVSFILNETKADIVLTSIRNLGRLSTEISINRIYICLDLESLNESNQIQLYSYADIQNYPTDNIKTLVNANQLAYIIFTSGTTGTPKGVMINHVTVVNVIDWINKTFQISPLDKLLFVTSISFDLSVYDIFGSFAAGTTIRLANNSELSEPQELKKIILEEKITIWDSAPQALQQLLPYFENEPMQISSLRLVMLSGDWISLSTPMTLKMKFKDVMVVSLGGATEATIWSNYYIVEQVDNNWKSIPYGRPIQNSKYYILDKYLSPVPKGQIGQIYISGNCLAIGYLGDKIKTETKFIDSPFENGKKMYATGDIGRMMLDNQIEILGRMDNQVKIRGYRVELGEIQCVLNQYEGISEGLVCAEEVDLKEKRLIAYITRKMSEKNNQEGEFVANWKRVFDSAYDGYVDEGCRYKNYSGWLSSYTGEAIPDIEMDEWLDNTLSMIRCNKTDRVLEVGCGTGLLLLNIAPECASYTACDVSSIAVSYLRDVITRNPEKYSNVDLATLGAHQISDYQSKTFDTVIMNSVIQYFPNIDYFSGVINDAINLIDGEGRIVLGDIRNYELAREFYLSKELSRSAGEFDMSRLNNLIEQHMYAEKELLISPWFFMELLKTNPNITSVEILGKNNLIDNEMSLFRYDVVLHINGEKTQQKKPILHLDASEKQFLEKLENVMSEHDYVIVDNVVRDGIRRLYEMLSGNNVKGGFDFCRLYNELSSDYYISHLWTPNYNKGLSSIIVGKKPIEDDLFTNIACSHSYENDKFFNVPMQKENEHQFIDGIKKYLKNKLPVYMVPNRLILIDKIPMTKNGKIDWYELSKLSKKDDLLTKLEAAKTDKELLLLDLWKEVLKNDLIGVEHNFFENGGHSLRASMLCLKIEKELGVNITVKDIFTYPTVRELAVHLDLHNQTSTYQPIEKKADINECRATSEQERLYIVESMIQKSRTYNIVDVSYLREELDIERLNQSLNQLLKRHQVFRLSFELDKDKVMQKINEFEEYKIEVIPTTVEEAISVVEGLDKPFQLFSNKLFKVALLKLDDHSHWIVFIVHHIIMDGVSLGIIKKEMSLLYNGKELDEKNLDYMDYSVWHYERLTLERLNNGQNYWTSRFEDCRAELSTFHHDYTKPQTSSYIGDVIRAKLDSNMCAGLLNFSCKSSVSLFSILLGSYYILLHKYTRNNDIVVGTVTANRTHPDISEMVGMFVNTLPIRLYIDSNLNSEEFMKVVEENVHKDIEHQSDPLQKILQNISIDFNNLFSSIVVLQNMELEQYKFNNISSEHIQYHNGTSKFDITFCFNQYDENLELEVEYSTQVYKKETVQQLIKCYFTILEQVLIDSRICIKDILLSSRDELDDFYRGINDTFFDYDKISIVDKIRRISQENIDGIAFVENGKVLTYGELNDKSDLLACGLHKVGIEHNTIISTVMNSGFELFIAWLGVLKAKCTLLPISPEQPLDRIKHMIHDSNSRLVIANEKLDVDKMKIMSVEEIILQAADGEYIPEEIILDDVAYIIYTSGTSGEPKGVKTPHSALLNLCEWHNHFYKVTSMDKATKYANVSFDASIWEVFPYLCAGASVHIISNKIRLDVIELNKYFEDNGITIAFLPTQICELFMNHENNSLRYLLTGGDKLRSFHKQNYTLVNNYGPTENAVVTLCYLVDEENRNIPIGTPIYNNKIFVWDLYHNNLPPGIPGELVVGGGNISCGYLNNQVLTDEKFVVNPNNSGEKLYRTGDLVRIIDNGNVEFLGRIDLQVKIRGYRIEIQEIEINILKCGQVEDVVVVVQHDKVGSPMLNCYYSSNVELDKEQLKKKLSGYLPQYMIPQAFYRMERLPINSSGKVDRKKIMQIPVQEAQQDGDNILLRNLSNNEQLLADLWKEILGIDNFSLTSNFFDLGGDSIKAIQLTARLGKHKYNVSTDAVYANPTIKGLASVLQEANYDISQKMESGKVVLSPIQKYFFRHSGIDHYCHSIELQIAKKVRSQDLLLIIDTLVEYHDALRMTFRQEQGVVIQEISEDVQHSYEIISYNYIESDSSEYDYIVDVNKLYESFNVFTGALVKVAHFSFNDMDIVFFCIHHLIVDGVSWRILLDDFQLLYQNLLNEKELRLPLKTNSYKEWTNLLYVGEQKSLLYMELEYWKKEISSPNDRIACLNEIEEEYRIYQNRRTISLKFSDGEYLMMKKCIPLFNASIEELFLSCLVLSLNRWCDVENIILTLEGHGRNTIVKGINTNRTVGWFTSIYPAAFKYDVEWDIETLIQNIKTKMHLIPNKGTGYGILREILEMDEENNDASFYRSQVTFNFLGELITNTPHNEIVISGFNKGKVIGDDRGGLTGITINALVKDGVLSVDFDFNILEADYDMLEKLTTLYKNNLHTILSVAQSIEAGLKGANHVEGIVPFSKVFYKDCYFNALFPILGRIRGGEHMVMANDLFYYDIDTERNGFPLFMRNLTIQEESEILDELGIECIQYTKVDNIILKIKEAISKDRPVLVQIDCFYEEIRRDMYNRKHWPHILLVVGYNDIDSCFMIIEHEDVDSHNYQCCTLSYKSLESSYYSNLERFHDGETFTVKEFSYTLSSNKDWHNIARKRYLNNLMNNRKSIYNGIRALGLFKEYLCASIETDFVNQVEDFAYELNNIINSVKVDLNNKDILFNGNEELKEIKILILAEFEQIRFIVMKAKFGQKINEAGIMKICGLLESVKQFEEKMFQLIFNGTLS